MSSGKVLAGAAWAWVALLVVLGWGFFLVGLAGPDQAAAGTMQRLAFMLLLSACASSAVAAVFHIRCFAVKLCALIRATSALGPTIPEQSRLRGIPQRADSDRG